MLRCAYKVKEEKASTHKSAKTHVGTVLLRLVTLTFDHLTSK